MHYSERRWHQHIQWKTESKKIKKSHWLLKFPHVPKCATKRCVGLNCLRIWVQVVDQASIMIYILWLIWWRRPSIRPLSMLRLYHIRKIHLLLSTIHLRMIMIIRWNHIYLINRYRYLKWSVMYSAKLLGHGQTFGQNECHYSKRRIEKTTL